MMAKTRCPLPILYEDDGLIAIDKPAGLLSISTGREGEKTAYRMVQDYVRQKFRSRRVFIVHRLDRETSGILLFAKNEELKFALQENWNHLVKRRRYLAVVEGAVSAESGQIRSWLKETKSLFVYSAKREGDGKLAITNYRTLKKADGHSLLAVDLETGRKNQIRVHMKELGHPVAGDRKYGALTDPFRRLGLHASELIVRHPFSGEKLQFQAATPAVFKKLFK